MNILEQKIVFSEVDAFINTIGEPYLSMIPQSLRNFLKKEKDTTYIVENPRNPDTFKEESISLITLISLNYWCNDKQKKRLTEKFKENETIKQKELHEKYNVDNIFKRNEKNIHTLADPVNSTEEVIVQEKVENLELTTIQEKNIFQKIIDKIKKFFKKNNY